MLVLTFEGLNGFEYEFKDCPFCYACQVVKISRQSPFEEAFTVRGSDFGCLGRESCILSLLFKCLGNR